MNMCHSSLAKVFPAEHFGPSSGSQKGTAQPRNHICGFLTIGLFCADLVSGDLGGNGHAVMF